MQKLLNFFFLICFTWSFSTLSLTIIIKHLLLVTVPLSPLYVSNLSYDILWVFLHKHLYLFKKSKEKPVFHNMVPLNIFVYIFMNIYSSASAQSFIFLQKSPAKKLSDALGKSLSCATSREPSYPVFSDTPEKPLNFTHVGYVNSDMTIFNTFCSNNPL